MGWWIRPVYFSIFATVFYAGSKSGFPSPVSHNNTLTSQPFPVSQSRDVNSVCSTLCCEFVLPHCQIIHVWYIYLHLPHKWPKCRQIFHTWMIWDCQALYFLLHWFASRPAVQSGILSDCVDVRSHNHLWSMYTDSRLKRSHWFWICLNYTVIKNGGLIVSRK